MRHSSLTFTLRVIEFRLESPGRKACSSNPAPPKRKRLRLGVSAGVPSRGLGGQGGGRRVSGHLWFSARVLGACAAVTLRLASRLGKPQIPWRLSPGPSQAFWRTWPACCLLCHLLAPPRSCLGERRWVTVGAALPTTCPLPGPPPEGRAGHSVQRALPRERPLCLHGLCGFSRSTSPVKGRTEAELPRLLLPGLGPTGGP